MQYFIYIGRDSKTIELFSKLNVGVFYAVPNCSKAIKAVDKIREKYDIALFFEQVDLSKDIADVRYMRKKYPGLYMVLVMDSLSKEEAAQYLKAGINNTIKFEMTHEALTDLSTFLKRRKEQKIKDLQLKAQNIKAFQLPLWKRIFDILFSGMAILCLSPLLIFTALAIRLESKGAVIYKSKRVGSNYQIFDFLKFRSMYMDAEERKKELMAQNEMDGLMFKMKDDPRITKVGKFIRKTSIDELPQFWNVLKGDMSLVGTRPPTVDEFEQYSAYHKKRLCQKPGLTGVWQVSGRSTITDFEEIVQMDVDYIDHWSIWRDIGILFKTVWLVVCGDDGAQ